MEGERLQVKKVMVHAVAAYSVSLKSVVSGLERQAAGLFVDMGSLKLTKHKPLPESSGAV